jgi:hypothetical protein
MAETMKHTGSEMSRLDSSERFAVITVMRGLFRVEVPTGCATSCTFG